MNVADTIIDLLINLITFMIDLLPDGESMPEGLDAAFSDIVVLLERANTIFPLDTLFFQLTMVFGVMVALTIWKLFYFAVKVVRGFASK